MDIDSLRCFDAAATTLNFGIAATRVHLSPAAFSDRMQRLEDELGQRLLIRTTRKMELSDAGRRLLPLSREIIVGADRLRATAVASDRPLPFELMIGTRAELGLSWLCPALSTLSRSQPERTIHLYNGDGPDLRTRLERGEIDAMVGSMRLTSPRLAYAALHEEDYVFVGRRTKLRNAAEATTKTLVDASPDLPLFRYFLDAMPDGAPWPFAQVEYMGSIGAIRRRVLEGVDRVAVLPRYFIRADIAAGRLTPLMPKIRPRSDTFRLVWRVGHPRADELMRLAAELRAIPLS